MWHHIRLAQGSLKINNFGIVFLCFFSICQILIDMLFIDRQHLSLLWIEVRRHAPGPLSGVLGVQLPTRVLLLAMLGIEAATSALLLRAQLIIGSPGPFFDTASAQ